MLNTLAILFLKLSINIFINKIKNKIIDDLKFNKSILNINKLFNYLNKTFYFLN